MYLLQRLKSSFFSLLRLKFGGRNGRNPNNIHIENDKGGKCNEGKVKNLLSYNANILS
jgi:hypothetical protein